MRRRRKCRTCRSPTTIAATRCSTWDASKRRSRVIAAPSRATPLDLAAHKELNDLLYRLDREDEFLQSYDEVASLYPDNGELPLAKAQFQFQREDYAAARENFERAVYALPASVTPHDGLALILARTAISMPPSANTKPSSRMEPANAHGWRNYAETLLRAGDAKKAEEAAQEAMEIEPEHQGALAILGHGAGGTWTIRAARR